MTGLVVKTVIICTLKFLKNGVCFVLFWQHRRVTFAERLSPFWQHHWKMSLPSLRQVTFAERLLPFWQHHWKMSLQSLRRVTFAERLSPLLASDFRRATFVDNAALQSHWRWPLVLIWSCSSASYVRATSIMSSIVSSILSLQSGQTL